MKYRISLQQGPSGWAAIASIGSQTFTGNGSTLSESIRELAQQIPTIAEDLGVPLEQAKPIAVREVYLPSVDALREINGNRHLFEEWAQAHGFDTKRMVIGDRQPDGRMLIRQAIKEE